MRLKLKESKSNKIQFDVHNKRDALKKIADYLRNNTSYEDGNYWFHFDIDDDMIIGKNNVSYADYTVTTPYEIDWEYMLKYFDISVADDEDIDDPDFWAYGSGSQLDYGSVLYEIENSKEFEDEFEDVCNKIYNEVYDTWESEQ